MIYQIQIFYRDVAFVYDVMSKQNELNISLQGRNKCIYDMWQKIQAFRKKTVVFQVPFGSIKTFRKTLSPAYEGNE